MILSGRIDYNPKVIVLLPYTIIDSTVLCQHTLFQQWRIVFYLLEWILSFCWFLHQWVQSIFDTCSLYICMRVVFLVFENYILTPSAWVSNIKSTKPWWSSWVFEESSLFGFINPLRGVQDGRKPLDDTSRFRYWAPPLKSCVTLAKLYDFSQSHHP